MNSGSLDRADSVGWSLVREEGDKPGEPHSKEAKGGVCPLWHPGPRPEPPQKSSGVLESSVGILVNVGCFLQTGTTAEVGRVGLPSALQIFLSPPFHGSWQFPEEEEVAGGQHLQGAGSQGWEPSSLLMCLRGPRERRARVRPASQTDPTWLPGPRGFPFPSLSFFIRKVGTRQWNGEVKR